MTLVIVRALLAGFSLAAVSTVSSVAAVEAVAAVATDATGGAQIVPLSSPTRVELYLDGARLTHRLNVAAGRSRIRLAAHNYDRVLQVDGADTWVVENRIDSATPPLMPPLLIELATTYAALLQTDSLIAGQEFAAERVSAEVHLRLGQRGVLASDDLSTWQAALDGVLALRGRITSAQLAQAAAWRAFSERAATEAVPGTAANPGLSYAAVLDSEAPLAARSDQANGGPKRSTNDAGDPAVNAQRAWNKAVERSAMHRTLVIERAIAGVITLVTERTDLRWAPQARLLVNNGSASLVRQAIVQVPAGLHLPTIPARLVGGLRAQPLTGAALTPREITAGKAPAAEQRSVTTSARAAGWVAEHAINSAREQTWEVPALTLVAPERQATDVIAELQKNAVTLTADEWVMAPAIAPILVRRLSIRLDAQPLAAGTFELVVDGTVLGRRTLPATAAGEVITLAAGEDQRVFLAETTRWLSESPPGTNHRRDGHDYRLRNLSADSLTFACYLTLPISAAKGVTVTPDPATTAGWKLTQPGIHRWELTLKPGAELTLHHGWTVDAEGKIRL